MNQVTLSVPEIRCEACEQAIRNALSTQAGIRAVSVDIPSRTVQVAIDSALTTPAAIQACIERAGFDVERE
jgi:copper chaperone CopZ